MMLLRKKRCFVMTLFTFSGSVLILFSSYQEIRPTSIWQKSLGVFRYGFYRPVVDELAELDKIYLARRDNAKRECSKLPPQHELRKLDATSGNIFYDPSTNSMYCSVAKIGSSTWKRLFLLLHNNKTKDPLSMSGLAIHMSYEMNRLALPKLPRPTQLEVINSSFSFVFARNPFHRIFSAYCDKVFMLAFETQRIMSNVRRKARATAALEAKRRLADGRSGNDRGHFVYRGLEYNVTFAETLEYATRSIDPHFKTISSQCNPCAIDFRVLGRLESLELDSRYVLAKLNRSHIMKHKLEDDSFKQSRDQGIIKELVERVFRILTAQPRATSKYRALVRTWKVFHIRGLVGDHIKYPLAKNESQSATAAKIIQLGIEAMNKSGDPATRLAQREKYYLQAFRSVPLAVMEKFTWYVNLDCRLFGYDCFPPDIFSDRKYGDEEDNIFSNDMFLYDEVR